MKLIAVSLSSECIQVPRCSFCYQNNERSPHEHSFYTLNTMHNLLKKYPDVVISFEYNGYNLKVVLEKGFWMAAGKTKTMTTMPQAVSKTFCGAIAHHDISAVALSYDSEKVSRVEEWVEKAKMIKEAGMKLSCNFLLESTTNIPTVPREILDMSDQLNLLALKPTGKIENKTGIDLLIQACKNRLLVAVDNCLGYQLGYIDDCRAGLDFLHVMPNGEIKDCCFQEKCFIWLKKNALRVAERAFDESLKVSDSSI